MPRWSPLGVKLKIFNEHPHLFHLGSPPPLPEGESLGTWLAPCLFFETQKVVMLTFSFTERVIIDSKCENQVLYSCFSHL